MKKLIYLFLTLIVIVPLRADKDIPRHGLSTHLGGAGALFEFEYQYRFVVSDKHTFSATMAINTVGLNIGFPIGLNYTCGQKDQLLAGIRFVPNILFSSFDDEPEVPFWSYLANLRIGYGRELVLCKENYTLYAYVSPFINLGSGAALPWAGIGLTHYF